MRKALYCFFMLYLLISSIPLFDRSANAATNEEFIGNATFNSGDVLFDIVNTSDFASGKYGITPNAISVNTTNPISRVELRDASDNHVIAQLSNIGSGQYQVSSPVSPIGTIGVRTAQPVTIPEGYFEWFRDPNKLVWMYDYEEYGGATQRYYVNTRPNEFEQPPLDSEVPGGCKAATSPTDTKTTTVRSCNEARDYRMGNLHISTLKVDNMDQYINISDADNLKFDPNFTFVQTGSLSQNNIKPDSLVTDFINKDTQDYRFTYTAIYDTPYDLDVSDNTNANGKVIRWSNKWALNVQGNIYKYPKMKVVAVTLQPDAKPDFTVTNLAAKNVCIAAGDSIAFEYTIRNDGASTSNTFKASTRIDGTEIKSDSYSGGLSSGQSKTATFNYMFSSTVAKTITVFVDSDIVIDEGTAEDNNTQSITVEPKPSGGCDTSPPTPPDLVITGNFTIVKPTLVFKDDQIARPQNITVTGGNNCTYVSHSFRFTQGSKSFVPTGSLSPEDEEYWLVFDSGYKSYGGGISRGTVTVYMKINTSCGVTKEVGPKTFEIITDPNNHPPELEIAWYRSATGEEVDTVVLGEKVSLKVKSETDPDEGDTLTREWFFSEGNAWISSLPSTYKWTSPYDKKSYTGIDTTVQGSSHKVCAITTDDSGATSNKACAILDVVGPEPIPIISGATVVKENRTMNPPLDADKSYSPIKGMGIDHPRDEWTNTAVWDDGTTSSWTGIRNSFNKPGKVTVKLNVFDLAGKKSIDPDTHLITVTPDLPPVIVFLYTDSMTRTAKTFQNNSYSPDGDGIEKYTVTYGYDWLNNGSCNVYENTISNDSNGFTFNPTRVGNYCFRVYAKEPEVYGKSAFKDYKVNVNNDNPEVTFTVTGIATEPMPVNVAGLRASDLVNWTATSLDKPWLLNGWSVTNDGRVISPRRESIKGNTDLNGNDGSLLSKYSVPLGSSNFGLNKLDIIMPTTTGETFFVNYSLGNGEFIVKGAGFYGGASSMYLAGTSHAAIELSCGGGSDCSRISVRPELDELIVIYDYESTGYNSKTHWNYWTRYKISNLRNRNTSPDGSGTFKSSEAPGPGYSSSGTPNTFSNGEMVGGFSRLKFNSDLKQINLTTRTIQSFKYGEATPYKTETYSNIPAVPRMVPDRQGGHSFIWPYNEKGTLDTYLFPMIDSRDTEQPYQARNFVDAKGNYYSIVQSDRTIVRWDGNTGMPTVIGTMPNGYQSPGGVDALGKYISFQVSGQDSDGNYFQVNEWMDMSTGAIYNYKPGDYGSFLPHNNNWYYNYQNGFGIGHINGYDSTFMDRGSGTMVNESTNIVQQPTGDSYNALDVKFISDTQYTGPVYYDSTVRGYRAPLYSYVPFTDQSPYSNEAFTYGQLINGGSQQIVGGTMYWSMLFHDLNYSNYHAGMSFKIQDYKNMYRVESHKDYVQLVKIINGRKTVLKRVSHAVGSERWIPYKIKIVADHIKVYEDNGLIIDVYDGTFTQGTMGPYSVADNTEFKGMSFQWTDADLTSPTPGIAIVDTEVTYETNYSDIENDPKLESGTQWTYHHVDTTKFLDAGDGKSGLSSVDGKTITNKVLTFDKVGVYKIDYRLPDDPHQDHRIANGDNMFTAYSKYSDWYTQYLIVHRRPFSIFTLGTDANNLVTWTDFSYDPDRCYNVGSCMGGYETSHGVFKKKFYYITPSGVRVDSKLVRPTESGSYTVAMAVADEYNAWSDWYEQTIDILIPVAANNPPTVFLTFPDGTYASPSPVSLLPTLRWNQADPDVGTIFSTFDLNVKNEWGSCVECVTNKLMDTPNTSWAWTMDNSLSMGQKYQVQVRISDGEAWSGWSSIGWMSTNTPPAAYMSFPYGTQANPTIVNTVRPTLQWVQSDPDVGTIFKYFQLQITNEDNTTMILDSGKLAQNTSAGSNQWQVLGNLPAGQKLRIRVKVWDQYGAESIWSPQVWMLINRPPIADFDWIPKPAFEGDAITLLNRSTDPDGDALAYNWQVTGPGYTAAVLYATVDAIIPVVITDGNPGDYVVTLTVTDTYGASGSVTKVVPVGDLSLDGWVKHTPQWEENRKAYNYLKTGDAERPRSADTFWSGEVFVLEAATNQPADRVTVLMSHTNMQTGLTGTGSSRTMWNGQLERENFESLPDGTYTFRFTAIWQNGHKETVDRIVTVRDPWTDFSSSVRKE